MHTTYFLKVWPLSISQPQPVRAPQRCLTDPHSSAYPGTPGRRERSACALTPGRQTAVRLAQARKRVQAGKHDRMQCPCACWVLHALVPAPFQPRLLKPWATCVGRHVARQEARSAAGSTKTQACLPVCRGFRSKLGSGWHPTWLASRWAALPTGRPSRACRPALPPLLVRSLPPPWPAQQALPLPPLLLLLLLRRRSAAAAWPASRAAASRPPQAARAGASAGRSME